MATWQDQLQISIQDFVVPTTIDLVSRANVVVNLNIRNCKFVEGGSAVHQPLLISLPTDKVKAYTGNVVFPDNFLENAIGATYRICFYAINVELTGPDLKINRGPKKTLDLLETAFQSSEEAFRQRFGSDMWGDGTTDKGASFVGYKAYIDDGTNYNVYAGVPRDGFPGVWNSTVLSNAVGGHAARPLTTALVDAANQAVTLGNDRPNLHVTTPGCITKMAQLIQPIQRAVQGDIGSWGFKNIAYHGYPIISDDFVPAVPHERYYLLNTRYHQMYFLQGCFFQWIPLTWIPKTDSYAGQIQVAVAFAGNRPPSQAVITDLSSSL